MGEKPMKNEKREGAFRIAVIGDPITCPNSAGYELIGKSIYDYLLKKNPRKPQGFYDFISMIIFGPYATGPSKSRKEHSNSEGG